MKTRFAVAVTALLASATIVTSAQAATFDFTVGGPATGTGKLTATDNGGGTFTITDISGTFNGAAITSLLAPGSLGGNDNLLLPDSDPQLTFDGVSFTTATNSYNLFYNPGFQSYRLITDVDGPNNLSVTFNAVSAAVPEPATWALMILGFGAVGGAMRRRQAGAAAKVRFA